MNCHQARQLISPFLDHQLSGREMLALQDHFAVCASCERERQSIRQVKMLLRGLRDPRLPRDFSQNFSQTVALRLEQPQGMAHEWRVLRLPPPRPQRGRRLATALALSCLTVVSFALPFAPEARERTALADFGGSAPVSPAFAVPAPSDPLLSGQVPERITLVSVSLVPTSDLTRLTPADESAPPRPAMTLAETDEAPAQSALAAAPRPQDMPFGNVQFAVFRPR